MAERKSFAEKSQWQRDNQRQVCVGLDTSMPLLKALHDSYPGLEVELRAQRRSLRTNADYVIAYNQLVISATNDIAGAYKPNKAFYEALGSNGFRVLKEAVTEVKAVGHQSAMTILDAKIQDIGSTNIGYGQAYFDNIGFDAVTVHPYLGSEALKVLTDRKDRGFLVMGRTSNPGAGELQDVLVDIGEEERDELMKNPSGEGQIPWIEFPLYRYVAQRVANRWNVNGNMGLVAGATYPEESGLVRACVGPDLFLLIPGVGEQGGKASDIVPQALRRGQAGVINSSRGIIFAKRLPGENQHDAIRRSAQQLHDEIVAAQLAT